MSTLALQKCTPASADSPHVTHDEVIEYLKELTGWQVKKDGDTNKLIKVYFFKDWANVVAFANSVADLADKNDHHPTILIEWGRVTVSFWTHVLGGLHKNDFIMAAKCEALPVAE